MYINLVLASVCNGGIVGVFSFRQCTYMNWFACIRFTLCARIRGMGRGIGAYDEIREANATFLN